MGRNSEELRSYFWKSQVKSKSLFVATASSAVLLSLPAATNLNTSVASNNHSVTHQRRGTGRVHVVPFNSYGFQNAHISKDVITKDDALGTALHYTVGARSGRLLPGVVFKTHLAYYSDDLVSSRLVWVITFSGPGVVIVRMGAEPSPGQHDVETFGHVETVIVDARSGTFLESETACCP